MASVTSHVIPPFDFDRALCFSLADRFQICLKRARELVEANGYAAISKAPCVPDQGASAAEIRQLESNFETRLPSEYREFLSICRYLKIDDGKELGGLDHDGVWITEIPWVSHKHRPGVEYLVFANFWDYADGDQLMFDLTEPDSPVIAYLHEHGPLFELYAPSFSLALWRLVHEVDDEE
jgi:SMI1 / KNR4 family (SUKH-1)